MTPTNLTNNNSTKTPDPMNSTHRTAIVAGCFLLVVVLVAAVYSKHARQTAPAPAPSAELSSAPSGPPVVAAVETPVPTPAPKKKVVKKRSSIVTYRNRTYGVSFNYPRKYALKTGDQPHLDLAGLGPVQMNFSQPGGVAVAAVELPRGSYAGSDVSSAFFNVSVNPNMNAAECEQFTYPSEERHEVQLVPSSKLIVGDLEFDEMEDTAGQAMKGADTKYFHIFRNGACYEFALAVGMVGQDGRQNSVKPDDVFLKLETILATVKINSGAVPEVAARASVHTDDGNSR